MNAIVQVLRRVRIVYKRSSTLLKCVVLSALVLSAAALIVLRSAQIQQMELERLQREQAAALEQENGELKDKIDKLGTLEGIEQIAEEELGLVDSDTVVFVPED